MNRYTIIVFVLITIALLGCVSSDKTVYFNQTLGQTITLYKDNTITIMGNSDYNISGAYKIDGNQVIATFPPFGVTEIFITKGNELIYQEKNSNQVTIFRVKS
jgi:hypothetical protein